MNVLITILVLSAVPPAAADDPLAVGRGIGNVPPFASLRFGISGGVGGGERARWPWAVGELAATLEVSFSFQLLRLRFGLGVRPGLMGSNFPMIGAHAGVELRLHLGQRFSLGLGPEVGFLNVAPPTGFLPFFALTVTAAALQLGARHEHELALAGSALWPSFESLTPRAGAEFAFLRYTYFFGT